MKLFHWLFTSILLSMPMIVSGSAIAQSASEFIDVDVGDDITCGLRADGSLSCPVRFIIPRFELPEDLPSVSNVSVGSNFACAVQTDGFLRCWGDDGLGQLQVPTSGAPYHTVSAGGVHACAINSAGSIECWGASANDRLAAPAGKYSAVSVSEQDACAMTSEGAVECWGGNDSGTSSPPSDLPAAIRVVSGRSASCALLYDGSVQCWGLDFPIPENGPFTDIDLTVSGTPDTGAHSRMCGLAVDGGIHCKFLDAYSGSQFQDVLDRISDAPGYTALAMQELTVCAVNARGLVECWGRADELPIPGQESGDPSISSTTGLRADIYSDTTVELFWDFPTDLHVAFAGHEIFRNGEVYAFTPNASSFMDTDVQPGETMVYAVRRVQVDGSTGELSETITVDTVNNISGSTADGDYQVPARPYAPTGVSASVYGSRLLELFWDRPASATLRGFEIHRDSHFLAFTRGVSFVDTVPETNRIYQYDIVPISSTSTAFQGVGSITVRLGDADNGVCR